MYQIPDGKLAHPSNRLGIFQTDGNYYVQSSMDIFTKAFAPHVPAGTMPKVYNIDNATGTSEDPWVVSRRRPECTFDTPSGRLTERL